MNGGINKTLIPVLTNGAYDDGYRNNPGTSTLYWALGVQTQEFWKTKT